MRGELDFGVQCDGRLLPIGAYSLGFGGGVDMALHIFLHMIRFGALGRCVVDRMRYVVVAARGTCSSVVRCQ